MIFSENRFVYFEAPEDGADKQCVLPNSQLRKEDSAGLVCSGNATLDRVEGLNDTQQSLTPERIESLNQHLAQYLEDSWGVENPDISRIRFLDAANFPPQYKQQFDFIKDPRISNAVIAVVPKDMWIKSQPSESHAEHDMGLVLIREDHFAGPDKIAWGSHELGHLLKYANNPETYDVDSSKPAFDDMPSLVPYPNNQVELAAFTKQFQFLKGKGVKREDVFQMLKDEKYSTEEMPFFKRIMDQMNY